MSSGTAGELTLLIRTFLISDLFYFPRLLRGEDSFDDLKSGDDILKVQEINLRPERVRIVFSPLWFSQK